MTRERVRNYSFFQVWHFNTEKFLVGHHQAHLSSLRSSPPLQIQDFAIDLGVGREGEEAEVRLQQHSFTRLFMGVPVPAERKQQIMKPFLRRREIPGETSLFNTWSDETTATQCVALFYCKIVRKPWPVITVSLLTKIQLMFSLHWCPRHWVAQEFYWGGLKACCLLCYAL